MWARALPYFPHNIFLFLCFTPYCVCIQMNICEWYLKVYTHLLLLSFSCLAPNFIVKAQLGRWHNSSQHMWQVQSSANLDNHCMSWRWMTQLEAGRIQKSCISNLWSCLLYNFTDRIIKIVEVSESNTLYSCLTQTYFPSLSYNDGVGHSWCVFHQNTFSSRNVHNVESFDTQTLQNRQNIYIIL